jgi:exosortase
MIPASKDLVKALPAVLALGWLWFVLINHLRLEWTLNEQYNYGWAVPLLCLVLAARRRAEVPLATNPNSESANGTIGDPRPSSVFYLLLFALALVFAPTRLFQEANPEWRLISWALALVTVGISLLWVRIVAGPGQFRVWRFPLAFFLIAVPWPTVLEAPVIQTLTRMNAQASVELVGLIGVPALARGNVIEISSGVVGIDEACSGIRSLQAMLMLALLFGEWYRLRRGWRWGLVAAGFALAIGFNLLRTTLLVWVAARQGVPAMAHWHDPASIAILIGGFTSLWLIAGRLARSRGNAPAPVPGLSLVWARDLVGSLAAPRSQRIAWSLLAWLALAEIGVQSWYLAHERHLPPPVRWTAVFPTNAPAYRELPLAPNTTRMLRQDSAQNATWRQDDGTRWQATFLTWRPGRTAVYLARSHTPEVCLAAAGGRMLEVSDLEQVSAAELNLPVRFYTVGQEHYTTHVLYCLWSDQSAGQEFDTLALTHGVRIGAVLAGQRLRGQRSLEIAVWGIADPLTARTELVRQLQRLVQREPAAPESR